MDTKIFKDVIFPLVSIVVLIYLSFLASDIEENQNTLIEQQNELYKQTQLSIEPSLHIWWQGDTSLNLIRMRLNDSNDNPKRKICIGNIGKLQTESVKLSLSWNDDMFYVYPKFKTFKNFRSTEVQCLNISLYDHKYIKHLRYPNEFEKPTTPIDKYIELNVSIECDSCKPKNIFKSFNLCVYERIKSDCNEESSEGEQ